MPPRRGPPAWLLALKPALVGPAIFLLLRFGGVQVDGPRASSTLRFLLFAVAQAVLVIVLRLQRLVQARADRRPLRVPGPDGSLVATTVEAHDLAALRSAALSAAVSFAGAWGLQRWRGSNVPVLLQIVVQPLVALQLPLTQIYFFGGDDSAPPLERPWPGPADVLKQLCEARADWDELRKRTAVPQAAGSKTQKAA